MPKRHIITVRKPDGTEVVETVQGRNQQEGRQRVKTRGEIVRIKTVGK